MFYLFLYKSLSNDLLAAQCLVESNLVTEISKNLLDQQDLMSQFVTIGLENQNLSSKIGLVNGEGDLEDISGKSNELGGGKIHSEW
jgi:hypothetical protein